MRFLLHQLLAVSSLITAQAQKTSIKQPSSFSYLSSSRHSLGDDHGNQAGLSIIGDKLPQTPGQHCDLLSTLSLSETYSAQLLSTGLRSSTITATIPPRVSYTSALQVKSSVIPRSSHRKQQRMATASVITVTKAVTYPTPTLHATSLSSSSSSESSSIPSAHPASSPASSTGSNSHAAVIGVVVACIIVAILIVCSCLCIRRRKSARKTFLPAIELESSIDLPPLPLSKLELPELPDHTVHRPAVPQRVQTRRQSKVQELASWKQTPFTALSIKSKQSSLRKKNIKGRSWYHHDPA